jgi:D-alanyl-lipoteichoic acid acyltransferase DltB (MBOAT superfamily)
MFFISFFPHLVAGPIVRAASFLPQLEKPPNPDRVFVSLGVMLIVWGVFKKAVVANWLAVSLVDKAFFDPTAYGAIDLLAATYGYAVQIYCDFSAYSDIAIGIAALLGYRFQRNFNQPYRAETLADFWRRWHMSLSSWLRDYLYIPLGGNRGGELLTSRNLWLTMVLGGLWHGANWTFILWGVWHGSIMAVERRLGYPRQSLKPGLSRHWAQTFLFVMIGWVMFRSPTVGNALAMYRGMIGANGLPLSDVVAWQIKTIQLCALAIAYAIIAKGALDVWKINTGRWMMPQRSARAVPALASAGWLAILTLSVAKLSADSFSPFLYFQF